MTYAYLRVSTDKQNGQNQRVGVEASVKTKSQSPEWLLELKERYDLPNYAIGEY